MVAEYSGLPAPVPVADGARVMEELNAGGGARMMSVATRELVGAAKSGAMSVVRSSSTVIAGRVAITTLVPRIRVRVTVNVEVEVDVEVVVGSLLEGAGAGAGSWGMAVASKGRRRMEERVRVRCGERIAGEGERRLRNRVWYIDGS